MEKLVLVFRHLRLRNRKVINWYSIFHKKLQKLSSDVLIYANAVKQFLEVGQEVSVILRLRIDFYFLKLTLKRLRLVPESGSAVQP
jgi:hypothetical protein